MALSDRLRPSSPAPEPAALAGAPAADAETVGRLKTDLHARLVDRLDLASIHQLAPEQLKGEIARLVGELVGEGSLPLNRRERDQLEQQLVDEILGLGPLEPLLRDPGVCDILVNTASTIYVERAGRLELTPLRFRDNDHLQQTINRIVARIGRRVDETSPMVDARLADGSRVNAIIPPLAVDGPILSIRRFGRSPLRMPDLLRLGALDEPMRAFLEACVKSKLNILISGGTGTGKTTMLNAMSAFIPASERIVTIEDAAELQLQQAHVVRLETRPANVEGKGEIVTRDLVRNSLRMRPDRIIVGEIRSVEAFDMLQAMNTGHEGSMATIHANTSRDALTRLAAMVGMSGLNISDHVQQQMIARALNLVVQLVRGADGRRRMVSISEITGQEGTAIQMQEIFIFDSRGVDGEGVERGEFVATGVRPRCLDRLALAGYGLGAELFSTGRRAR